VVLDAGVTALTSCAPRRGAPVSTHQVWAGNGQPLPSARSRRRARIWEGQGPRRERAQRAQAGDDVRRRLLHAPLLPPSTRARPEQAGGGQLERIRRYDRVIVEAEVHVDFFEACRGALVACFGGVCVGRADLEASGVWP
jgi:hypothetical protein